jgi:hypothetical protein
LTVVEDVAAANDHGALLVEQVDKDHDKQQAPNGSAAATAMSQWEEKSSKAGRTWFSISRNTLPSDARAP